MILLIDNYDSFTYNLYQYLGAFDKVTVVRNDQISTKEIYSLNPDKIVISPGPKTPNEAGNCIPIIKDLCHSVPILGICLGHQCIGQAFGARIVYAKALYHGKTSEITHTSNAIFNNIPNPVTVARYHSLVVDDQSLPNCFNILSKTNEGEIMAMTHKIYPLTGLQFHPESISTKYGFQMIQNFAEGKEI
ncbi:aminodeoxychorismate/anthranilate synthase component II [Serpentinicella sp. ANB-PHB4]|uniref:anthranilate synthase component II n=1 Tax=Serpentinicella sp. ANB-PHB4 TaxID=3074076 RepID=UPI002861879C|nr:aminodeoxychorismate/anthranilate synthase component II [Serpentinicella sp. ANB-PHB4]MDR5659154.1 aminodeoxychorismate/anthranilate synthase component II [Serpentinicella sp. ANB-PHB4]